MWFLNSLALSELLERGPAPLGLERENGHFTGRLFDEDRWLQQTLGSTPPDFAATSSRLAASGITGITDLSPRNDPAMARHFAAQRAGGFVSCAERHSGCIPTIQVMPRYRGTGLAASHDRRRTP